MTSLFTVKSGLLVIIFFALPIGSVNARDLTSVDLQEWLDPYNRSKISGFHQFLNSTGAMSDFSYDGIRLWSIDHTISFEGMPVKFIGATPDGRHAFVTLANVLNSDLQPIVSSYFCKLNARHITLDWAVHETGQSHVVIDCGRYVDEATYDQCLNFVDDIRYIKGDHNALPSCKDLVYDFTEYTDNDVCLGFTKRKDFRKEEKKRGLDCDAWFEATYP